MSGHFELGEIIKNHKDTDVGMYLLLLKKYHQQLYPDYTFTMTVIMNTTDTMELTISQSVYSPSHCHKHIHI